MRGRSGGGSGERGALEVEIGKVGGGTTDARAARGCQPGRPRGGASPSLTVGTRPPVRRRPDPGVEGASRRRRNALFRRNYTAVIAECRRAKLENPQPAAALPGGGGGTAPCKALPIVIPRRRRRPGPRGAGRDRP